MRARYHGEPIPQQAVSGLAATTRSMLAPDAPPNVGFMFADLVTEPGNLLPKGAATIAALGVLGEAMAADPGAADSLIPAAYTYFGQFIDHDITKTEFPSLDPDILKQTDFPPIAPDVIGVQVRNVRTLQLDLESVYEGGDADASPVINPDGSMGLGKVSPTPAGAPPTIPTADKDHDLPRLPKTDQNEDLDRRAKIGDPRNDENLIVAQMHVAFLRSHNALMRRDNLTGDQARTAMRRRYQWAVLHDFLPRVCHGPTIEAVLKDGATVWPVDDKAYLFMPVEFSGAAYRFGHSMVRAGYSHNTSFPGAPFFLFFTFTALSGDLRPGPTPNPPPPISQQPDSLPDNWVIDWPRFFSPPGQPTQPGQNPARRIDTKITPPLAQLPDTHGAPIADVMGKLASRNLSRGYLLGLPTGQAIASHLGVPILSEQTLSDALPEAARKQIKDAKLLERTPLWFYVLAEAGDPAGTDGQTLGPVGSRIVAETLWNMAKHAPDSVIAYPPSDAELATGEFTLKGLIKIGQDAGMPPIVIDPPKAGA